MISELALAGRKEHRVQFLDNQRQSNKHTMAAVIKNNIISTINQDRNILELGIPGEAC
jgi:hypothetical protein